MSYPFEPDESERPDNYIDRVVFDIAEGYQPYIENKQAMKIMRIMGGLCIFASAVLMAVSYDVHTGYGEAGAMTGSAFLAIGVAGGIVNEFRHEFRLDSAGRAQ